MVFNLGWDSWIEDSWILWVGVLSRVFLWISCLRVGMCLKHINTCLFLKFFWELVRERSIFSREFARMDANL